ncbi:DNA-formamidopyrimidine glycosylase family protein [Nesterenkonia sp. CL21]|uniref:Fpg/Nei family DNA glycosylase n=1 Tax=Nesterenkonia sp. CL21 TaxID=3064894 RepID=UPI0028792A06|nr:DNA-formamidopyrimidine glycosylase family protein [Nesterenkonia sp. CL21]MDS2171165.1 DNA-formamidopyrimidine glycosylase family protein [Nesterenkonia sp. CL21]
MPEGDSIYREAALLHGALAGRTLLASEFRVPAFAAVDVAGQTIERVHSRGKHLLIHLPQAVLHSHLKMEGTWHVYGLPADGSRPHWRRPGHTARCVLTTAGHQAVGFSLGELHVFSPAEAQKHLAHLGPDPLGDDWDAGEAWRRLLTQPDRAIGVALLDQRNLAGVGNVYRSEICFLAGFHPEIPVRSVPDLERVLALAHRLLGINKLRPRRCTTGTPGGGTDLWVYGRGGKPCLRCRGRIERATSGEAAQRRAAQEDRVIYFCPRCQPPPGSPAAPQSPWVAR